MMMDANGDDGDDDDNDRNLLTIFTDAAMSKIVCLSALLQNLS